MVQRWESSQWIVHLHTGGRVEMTQRDSSGFAMRRGLIQGKGVIVCARGRNGIEYK